MPRTVQPGGASRTAWTVDAADDAREWCIANRADGRCRGRRTEVAHREPRGRLMPRTMHLGGALRTGWTLDAADDAPCWRTANRVDGRCRGRCTEVAHCEPGGRLMPADDAPG